MIATHNTMTYLRACNPLFNLFSFLWRCQNRSLAKQKQDGVGYFDIRCRLYQNEWKLAHGLVVLDANLEDVLPKVGKKKPFRLILEKGDDLTEYLFGALVERIKRYYPNLHYAVVKQGWKVLYENPSITFEGGEDRSYVPFHSDGFKWKELWQFLKHFSWPKRYAKQHNQWTDEEKKDKKNLYWLDFYQIRKK